MNFLLNEHKFSVMRLHYEEITLDQSYRSVLLNPIKNAFAAPATVI